MTLPIAIHLGATWMLVGLIWVVQIVVYPQFLRLRDHDFIDYHFAHCFRIGLIVAPLLFVEFASAGWLLYEGHREGAFLLSLVLMVGNWISTGLLQAPAHTRLMRAFDDLLIRRLIRSNWLRTVFWTVRGGLLFWAFTSPV